MASQHTAEFRQEAVRVALTSGLICKQVSADFGIGFSPLSRWIQLERKELPAPAAQSDLEAEVTRLRQENRLLREERDVLKKATQRLHSSFGSWFPVLFARLSETPASTRLQSLYEWQ